MSFVVEVIKPKGILDETKATEFRQKISETIKSGAKVILVDFSDVTFMDSSGLGALVFSLKTVRAAGAQLFLCSINEQIKMLFELTSLDSIFNIVTDRAELERSLQ
ncbi:STAS domain-containing protein [Pleurocapsales cyanobacterium LEGE 06147]|nr:STAS domain-containing protein [Pleurocapsales cyanobacterium LEGE 06147]